MKKVILILLVFIISSTLLAHPAGDVKLDFDLETHTLTIVAEHSVKDVQKHYISDFTIELNGEEVITQKLQQQDDNDHVKVFYKLIDAKQGDEITVVSKCNKFGKKRAKLILK